MVAVVSLFLVLTLSILITRIATVALTQTGMTREASRFQARSALTGVGFTTTEAEQVVRHPVRRRIVLLLMLVGNAGFVTVISSLILTFVDVRSAGATTVRLLALFGGIAGLWALSRSIWLDRALNRLIGRALRKYTRLDTRHYSNLLHLAGEYGVSELLVERGDWMADRTLGDLKLREEGIAVLGIERRKGDTYLGAPGRETRLRPGDLLIVYGRTGVLTRLDERRKGVAGDEEHERLKRLQQRIRQRENRETA